MNKTRKNRMEDDVKTLVKGLEGLSEGKSTTAALIEAGMTVSTEKRAKILEPQQNNALQAALEDMGVTEDYVGQKLKECMEATITKVIVKGKAKDGMAPTIEVPDHKLRLQAIQIYAHICGFMSSKGTGDSGDKHLHLHGKTKEELDELVRKAQTSED